MPYKLYDYLTLEGTNAFNEWAQGLQVRMRARLDQKIDMLEEHGIGLLPETLTGSDEPSVMKLRVRVDGVQLRPLLCRGPSQVSDEFTFLLGAKEVQGKIVPRGGEKLAGIRRKEILRDPGRRTRHERIT